MAAKSDKVTGDEKVNTTNAEDEAKQVPDSARTNGEKLAEENPGVTAGRQPQVGEPVETSFDERTSSTQPFILDNGTQDNGARDLEHQEGSKGQSSREGNQSVREDTKDAIEDGVIPASDEPDVPNLDEPPKNPVK